jgi:hypothetical protein
VASDVLTDQSSVQCPHGGMGQIAAASQKKAQSKNGNLLTESDKHIESGSSFMKGTTPSPCLKIEWSLGANKVQAGQKAVLTNQSIGKCLGPGDAPQGMALINNSKPAQAT